MSLRSATQTLIKPEPGDGRQIQANGQDCSQNGKQGVICRGMLPVRRRRLNKGFPPRLKQVERRERDPQNVDHPPDSGELLPDDFIAFDRCCQQDIERLMRSFGADQACRLNRQHECCDDPQAPARHIGGGETGTDCTFGGRP